MEVTKEQQILQQIINEAWENEKFKKWLIDKPEDAIRELTGETLKLPDGKKWVVRDQTDQNTIYINIPLSSKLENLELNEEQLETVAGGVDGIYGDVCTPKGPFRPFKEITIH